MKLTVLGCMGAYPYDGQGTSAYLLESDGFCILIDAGSSTLLQLEKIRDPLTLDAVILSHYHYDHIADLGVLQYFRQLAPNEQPTALLPIYGHQEDQVHFAALTMKDVSKGVAYSEKDLMEIGPFQFSFLKTVHPVPCFAMRIVEKRTGKTLVYTGDSGYLEEIIPFSENADILLADTYLFSGNERHFAHLTAKESGEIAKMARVKKLILTHLPQHGSLELLKTQAEKAMGDNQQVLIAKVGLTIKI